MSWSLKGADLGSHSKVVSLSETSQTANETHQFWTPEKERTSWGACSARMNPTSWRSPEGTTTSFVEPNSRMRRLSPKLFLTINRGHKVMTFVSLYYWERHVSIRWGGREVIWGKLTSPSPSVTFNPNRISSFPFAEGSTTSDSWPTVSKLKGWQETSATWALRSGSGKEKQEMADLWPAWFADSEENSVLAIVTREGEHE